MGSNSPTVFPVKNGKSGHYHLILHIQIKLDDIFQLKLTILIFWTKFIQERYFRFKTEKMNITIEFCIFELIKVKNFSLNWQFWFLDQIFLMCIQYTIHCDKKKMLIKLASEKINGTKNNLCFFSRGSNNHTFTFKMHGQNAWTLWL